MGLRSIVETAVLWILVFVMLFVSSIKLVPQIHTATAAQRMDEQFRQFATVSPTVLLGYQPDPIAFKILIGILELTGACGALLRSTRRIGSAILVIAMTGAVTSNLLLGEYRGSVIPLILDSQSSHTMGFRSIIETVVLLCLMFVFLMASSVKVFPSLHSADLTQMMDDKFRRYPPVCVTVLLGYQPNPMSYKLAVGIVELAGACGLLLGKTRKIGSAILTVVMIGAVQTHICLEEYQDCVVPFVLGLLSLYFFITTRNDEARTNKRKVE